MTLSFRSSNRPMFYCSSQEQSQVGTTQSQEPPRRKFTEKVPSLTSVLTCEPALRILHSNSKVYVYGYQPQKSCLSHIVYVVQHIKKLVPIHANAKQKYGSDVKTHF